VPKLLPALAKRIDQFNERIGRLVGWLTLAMIGVGAFNALARYLGKYTESQLASNALIELQWYLFSLVFLLGAAHTLKQNKHVRVDVFYGRLSDKKKAWIDLIGSTIFLIPFCLFALWACFPSVMNSIDSRELSPDPGGLPRYPIKAMILACFSLLLLQGLSEVTKNIQSILGHREGEE